MKDKKWLVTVQGYDIYYNPPVETISKVITLPVTETPVEWFLKKPAIFSRFEFKPLALINYWEITELKENVTLKKMANKKDQCVVYSTECPNKCSMTQFEITTAHIWKCLTCSRIIDLRIENRAPIIIDSPRTT